MPKTKASKRQANLGAYVKKKPRLEVMVQESDGESAQFSGALSDVEASTSTLVTETNDNKAPDDVLAWNDEDVEELASHLRHSFMRRLQNALRAHEKIKKQTAHLRTNGYPDIRTFWLQVPPSHEAEPSPIKVISDSGSESQGIEAESEPGEPFTNQRSIADLESCLNENKIPIEEVLDLPTTHTEPQNPGLSMAEQPPANHQPVRSLIAQPALQQGTSLLTLKLVNIPMGPAWRQPPKDSKAITEAIKALPNKIKDNVTTTEFTE
ncbi:hypothetical protein FS837_000805 [Tulasnella sp. UAMH 9824]|nr:hypothetical protein FS837_000805 [Tulasnella sp. UAMH 9824]